MSPRTVAIIGSLFLVALLLGARLAEVLLGHTPTAVLNVAFGASVTAALAVLAASHISNGGVK